MVTQAQRGPGGRPGRLVGCMEKHVKGTLCPLLHRTPQLPGATREGLGRREVPTLSLGSCLMGRVAPDSFSEK